MLDLTHCSRALDAFSERFVDDALPPGLSALAFQRFDAGAYTQAELAYGREAWQLRTLDEYRSQMAFTELLADLSRVGGSIDAIQTCVRVVRDEARHVELCKRLVVALGGELLIPGDPVDTRPNPAELPMERILHLVVGSLCIGETFSVRLIAAVRERTLDGLTKEVMTLLTADETIHSRFGWTLLEVLTPQLTAGERATVCDRLPWFLQMARRAIVPAEADGAELHPLVAHPTSPFGSMAPRARREVFYEVLERDIVARFEALGWPGRASWRAAEARDGVALPRL